MLNINFLINHMSCHAGWRHFNPGFRRLYSHVMNGKMSLVMTSQFWKSYKTSCSMYDRNKRNWHHQKNATYKNKLHFPKCQQRQSSHGINWIGTFSEWMLLEEFHIPFLCFPSGSWCLVTSIPLSGASSQLLSIDWADKLNRDRFPLLAVSTECPACTFGRSQENNKSAFTTLISRIMQVTKHKPSTDKSTLFTIYKKSHTKLWL